MSFSRLHLPAVSNDISKNAFGDNEHALHNYFASPEASNMFGDGEGNGLGSNQITKEALQSLMASNSRSASLQPFQRKPSRPRKASITEGARKPKHERQRSKDQKRISHDRKAFSASAELGAAALLNSKRWEDLLDAAASATEEDNHELTPVCHSLPDSSCSSNCNHSDTTVATGLNAAILFESKSQSIPVIHDLASTKCNLTTFAR